MIRLYSNHAPWHGSGPLRQWIVTVGKRAVRFSIGGYGNVPKPTGLWTLIPKTTIYPSQAYYLRWLSASVSYHPNNSLAVAGAAAISFRKKPQCQDSK